ncbi:glycosyltransferase family 2 protein [Ideonella sp.]|uniref:glycosyltransferase family 2 protein n=1 Tax=Ideonella sp. TaxID=1929293 RepID=UPI002B460FC4|nr:glycosyltransferase family 2 protein [Ideonella sp.]HJV70920.1 glycosyltransferase family 2 protein [Ideonella sp.]
MSFPFFRTAAPAQTAPGAAPAEDVAVAESAPLGRLVVERLEGVTVVGWAAGPDGRPADIELLIGGQPVPARVEAMHRRDVLDALGLTADVALGFRVVLPPSVWGRDGAPAAIVALRGADLSMPVPLPAALDAVAEALRGQPGLQAWEERLAELAGHARAVDAEILARAPAGAWLQAQVRERGGWAALATLAQHPGARPQGHVERVDLGVVEGWAWLACLPDEAIGLRCGGQPVDCAVIRIEREDVQRALNSPRRHLGFEIEIPATVWQHEAAAAGALQLSVHVAGRPLAAQPLELDHGRLMAWLEHQRRAEAAAGPGETDDERRHRQYTTLLVIEHLAAAGLWKALNDEQRRFVLGQVERYGVADLLGPAVAEQVDDTTALAGLAGGQDYATITVWRLLREFNAALDREPSQPLQALQAVLQGGSATGTIGQRFLWSVIPYFCGRGLYPSLRPYLDVARLRALAACESAWELSLLLPEAVASADFALAAAAMKKIAAGSPGWLNTECVACAVQGTVAAIGRGPLRDDAAAALLEGFLDLLGTLSDDAYWSRLHDEQLMAALVSMLGDATGIAEPLATRAAWLAVRCYALVPDFWRAAEAVAPPVGGWPPPLRQARSRFECVGRALARRHPGSGAEVVELAQAIAWLRSATNVDADLFARELAMAETLRPAPGRSSPAAPLLLHADNDLLRLATHPAASEAVTPSGVTLIDEIRRLADVPAVPRRPVVAELVRRCLGAKPGEPPLGADERSALRSLSQRANHYLGVRLACADWLRCRPHMDAGQRAERLIELRELWVAAFEDCLDLPQPPASLTASHSLLDAAQASLPDDGVGRVLAEWRDLLLRRYGERAGPALASACAEPAVGEGASGHSTLVAIYSCRRNLPTRVQAIRDTWAHDLTALGIPWIVVVGDGNGQLEGDVLGLDVSDDYEALPAKTLALVDWVHRHTRFEHLLKIDDDCHFSVEAYFAQAPYLAHHYHGRRLHRGIGGTDRVWHQRRSRTERAARSTDKSPEPSIYADGGAAYCLSRHAMAELARALQTTRGARLTRSAYLEDKLLGDLLATRGIGLSSHGHYTLIRRRFGPDALPVNAFDNLFYPSRQSPTLVTHLDGHTDLPQVQAGLAGDRLLPPRVWPTAGPVRLGGSGTNQLELLSPPGRVAALADAPVLLVAVARNERLLAPHFLQHYRALGVQAFAFVDNLSDDGTREYLAAQPDVLLYSADTEYKHSHYGVSWQQAVLGAQALGQWVVLADLDEFLVYPGCETVPIERWIGSLEAAGHDAARVLMVDMYPAGDLDAADFSQQAPFEAAPCFDREPLLHWALGSGCYSNGPTYLSALRHRLIPDSAPNLYTSQKIAVFKYQPWVRLSEGLHYASNLRVAPEPVWFAHFKYHAGFRRKVRTEVARKQHFNGAEEYRKYAEMLAEARAGLSQAGVSETYTGSSSWLPPR